MSIPEKDYMIDVCLNEWWNMVWLQKDQQRKELLWLHFHFKAFKIVIEVLSLIYIFQKMIGFKDGGKEKMMGAFWDLANMFAKVVNQSINMVIYQPSVVSAIIDVEAYLNNNFI